MKKVLSLVLAVMMVVGMSTTAFAALTTATAPTATLSDIVGVAGDDYSLSVTLDNAVTAGTDTVLTLADIKTAGTDADLLAVVDSISITADAATTDAEIVVNFKSAASLATGKKLVFDDPKSAFDLTVTFGTVTIAAAPAVTGKVPTKYEITGFSDNAQAIWDAAAAGFANEVTGDHKFNLPITADMFTWKDKNDKNKSEAVASAEVSGLEIRSSQLSKVGVRRVYQKNTANTIRDVELRDSEPDVRIRTVQFYTKTSETDVSLKLALTFKGSTSDAPEVELNFEIANGDEIIEEGQNEASSYGHIFLKADATVRNVEFQGDDDEIVFATKTVVKGQKYYFNVSTDLIGDDSKVIADNPEVDSIYNVYQTNMANATIQFKNLDREFFVYNGEGKLLGTTKDSKLPLASKYILTTAKVDFGGADEEPVEEPTVEEPADVDAPPMGGGEVPPSNNYNPNTGL